MNKSIIKRIIFGLGSNLGDKKHNLNIAIEKLEKKLELQQLKISEIFQNKALLKPNSPKDWDLDFFNIAVSANIDINKYNAEEILKIIKIIESEMGRNHQQIWAPRQIDIDILAISDLVINIENKLKIPHQELLNRDFFLKTFSEIEPDWTFPRDGKYKNVKIFKIFSDFLDQNKAK